MVGSTGEAGSFARESAAGADASAPSLSCLLGVAMLLFAQAISFIAMPNWLSMGDISEEKKTTALKYMREKYQYIADFQTACLP